MTSRHITRLQTLDHQLALFLCSVVFLAIASGIFQTTFNNFLNDTFNITAKQRGQLEFPRELPGFLVAVTAGILFFLPEVWMASLAAFGVSLGLVGLAFLTGAYSSMILCMVLWSFGTHLLLPLNTSIGLSLARQNRGGTRLGQIGGIRTFATIIGGGIVWIGLEYLGFNYTVTFCVGATWAFLAALIFLRMKPRGLSGKGQRRFVLKRKYWLFYVLNVLSGARKQVFITFGPWVLINIFSQPAQNIAKLWIVAAVIGIFFNPRMGRIVDRFGERFVLMAGAISLMAVCLGYGYAQHLHLGRYAIYLVYLCYILDQLLFSAEMARSTYLNKIAETKGEVTATLSMGVSLDHFISMLIPTLGGIVWVFYGYQYVFLGAAGVAILSLIAASLVRTPETERR